VPAGDSQWFAYFFSFFIQNPEIGDLLRVAVSGDRLRQRERERVKSTLTLRRARASLNPHVGKRGDDRFAKIFYMRVLFLHLPVVPSMVDSIFI
jgi:hypothetical protein